jgi:hypothetical protein
MVVVRTATKTTLHRSRLRPALRPLFWDHDLAKLDWNADHDLVVGRILAAGPWDAVRWLYHRLGPAVLRQWLVRRRGSGLSPRQLRFWETVLHISRRQVNAWLAQPARQTWGHRCHA